MIKAVLKIQIRYSHSIMPSGPMTVMKMMELVILDLLPPNTQTKRKFGKSLEQLFLPKHGEDSTVHFLRTVRLAQVNHIHNLVMVQTEVLFQWQLTSFLRELS